MADIVISGNTSGAVTLRAPDVSGTTLLTLPTTSGTIVTTAGATSLTTSGNLTFTGTGNRITGDFSNATAANRVMIQTSTVNGGTFVSAIPNGSGTSTAFVVENSSTPLNNSFGGVQIIGTVDFVSGARGSGTQLPMTFQVNIAERMRIDTSGNVGIGTSSPAGRLDVSDSINAGVNYYLRNRNSGAGSKPVILNFAAADTVATDKVAASIQAQGDSGNYIGAALIFSTRGSDTVSERMRVDSSGFVGIGTNSPGSRLSIEAATAPYGQVRIANSSATGEATINIGRTNQTLDNRWTIGQGANGAGDTFTFYTGGSNKATLTTAGVWSTTGGGTSDLRTKKDIDYVFDNGVESVLKLKPTKFKFLSSPDKQRRGFIAQDVLETIPDLVLGDGEREGGTYGLDYDGILALAVKAIQEQQTMIQELKARIDVLEGAK